MRNFLVTLLLIVSWWRVGTAMEGCADPDSVGDVIARNISSVDTIDGLAIYVAFPEDTVSLGSDTLLTWNTIFGDSANFGPSHILAKSSFNKHILNLDVNPELDNQFLVLPHSQQWYFNQYDTTGFYFRYLKFMNQDVLIGLDSVLNFSHYDADNDSIVDYVGLIYRQWTLLPPPKNYHGYARIYFPVSSIFVTNDTTSDGRTVVIDGAHNGHVQRPIYNIYNWKEGIVAAFVHEYCHHIDVIDSILHSWRNGSGYHFLGTGFPAPSNPVGDGRASYFSPWCALRFGWLTAADIKVLTEPVYSDTISDYISSGDLYKYVASQYQYFLVTNRQLLHYNESLWPCKGLFIYHIDESNINQYPIEHKTEDLETADGMFAKIGDSLMVPAPDTGLDDVDWKWICQGDTACENLTGASFGDDSDSYESGPRAVFSDSTNPNSNLYSFSNGRWRQITPSHFRVNIVGFVPGDSTSMVVDLLVNNWYGELASSTVWGDTTQHTGYAITGDITVPAGQTLTIRRGTTVYFQRREDNENGGAADTLCEIIVYGTLIAEGTASDSILFVPSSEQLGTAQSEDWYGIRFMPGSTGSLRYCAIRDGVIGVELEDTSEVAIAHCQIKSHGISGIDAYRCDLQIDSSTIMDNTNYGIYAYKSALWADSCLFRNNEDYGLYCWYNITDSTIITNCVIDQGNSGISDSSQYGIYTGIDKMRISNCTIKEYGQGAIRLDNSDCFVNNSDLRGNGVYGVYATSYANAKIRRCNFSSLSIGVKATSSSIPDLGRVASADSGKSDFENCSSYYIHFVWPSSPPPTLYAEANYFGRYGPQAKYFYGNVDYTPYITYDPFPRLSIDPDLPAQFALNPNYPNPFNPSTTISFSLYSPGPAVVNIYNVLGQKVKMLVDDNLSAGEHAVIWNGENDFGEPVGSGVYFYTIQTAEHFESKKMVLIR